MKKLNPKLIEVAKKLGNTQKISKSPKVKKK